MMSQNMEAVGQDYRITKIVFDQWGLLMYVYVHKKIPREKKCLHSFFLHT